jgi:hypothetical protein
MSLRSFMDHAQRLPIKALSRVPSRPMKYSKCNDSDWLHKLPTSELNF